MHDTTDSNSHSVVPLFMHMDHPKAFKMVPFLWSLSDKKRHFFDSCMLKLKKFKQDIVY